MTIANHSGEGKRQFLAPSMCMAFGMIRFHPEGILTDHFG